MSSSDHRVKKVFGCLSVRSGVIIIGWLGTICNTLTVVGTIGYYLFAKYLIEMRKRNRPPPEPNYTEAPPEEGWKNPIRDFDFVMVFLIGMYCVSLFMYIILLVGVYNKKVSFVKAFWVYMKTCFVMTLVALVRHLCVFYIMTDVGVVMVYRTFATVMLGVNLVPTYMEITIGNSWVVHWKPIYYLPIALVLALITLCPMYKVMKVVKSYLADMTKTSNNHPRIDYPNGVA